MESYAMSMNWKTGYFKTSILYKSVYRFNTIPMKIPTGFFEVTDKIIIKCLWKYKLPKITQNKIWKRRTKLEKHTTIVINIVWNWSGDK